MILYKIRPTFHSIQLLKFSSISAFAVNQRDKTLTLQSGSYFPVSQPILLFRDISTQLTAGSNIFTCGYFFVNWP